MKTIQHIEDSPEIEINRDRYYLLNKTISDKECIELIGWKPPRSGFKEEKVELLAAAQKAIATAKGDEAINYHHQSTDLRSS